MLIANPQRQPGGHSGIVTDTSQRDVGQRGPPPSRKWKTPMIKPSRLRARKRILLPIANALVTDPYWQPITTTPSGAPPTHLATRETA